MDFLMDFCFYTVVIGLWLGLSGKVLAKHIAPISHMSLWTFIKCGIFASFIAVCAANILPHFYS
jgi:hypothetical protein